MIDLGPKSTIDKVVDHRRFGAHLKSLSSVSILLPLVRRIDRAQVRAGRDRPGTQLTTQTNKEI